MFDADKNIFNFIFGFPTNLFTQVGATLNFFRIDIRPPVKIDPIPPFST